MTEMAFDPIDPHKTQDEFRNYKDSARQRRVEDFYNQQHRLQTYSFVKEMQRKHLALDKGEMSVWEALEYLDSVVDDSDPDTNLSQIQHALQSAEAVRREYPGEEHEWLQLVALLHDLGKLLAVTDEKRGLVGEPQWAVVGDTFPVGCKFEEASNVFPEFFKENPDSSDPVYSSELGIYSPKCGFSSMDFSFGHDEYLYQVFVRNGCKLPPQALYMIRFHSFYPWHKHGGYKQFADDFDMEMLPWLKSFNKFDLYSKADDLPNRAELETYYKKLIDKYFPAKLKW
jgi:inositol oxygenase